MRRATIPRSAMRKQPRRNPLGLQAPESAEPSLFAIGERNPFLAPNEEGGRGDWASDAAKAWTYYRRNGRVKDGINYWLALAIGEDTEVSCENEKTENEARDFMEDLRIHSWLRDMMQQLLVKGDCTGFIHENQEGISRVQCINPLSVEVAYTNGVLTKAVQNLGKGKGEKKLSLDAFIHRKWDVPEFEERGLSMVLPAFGRIEDLNDLRKTDRVITKRYREPLAHAQIGGVRNKKYIHPSLITMDHFRKNWDNLTSGKILITDDLVKLNVYGLDGQVSSSEERYQRLEQAISYDLGLPRSVSSGDGPNRETANASMKKVWTVVADIRRIALEIVRWATDHWQQHRGSDDVLHFRRIETDPSLDIDLAKVYLTAYRLGVVSRATVQNILKIANDTEQARLEEETHSLNADQVLSAANQGILRVEEARAKFGIKGDAPKSQDDTALEHSQERDVALLYAQAGVVFEGYHAHGNHRPQGFSTWDADSIYTPVIEDMEKALATSSRRVHQEIRSLKEKASLTAGQDARMQTLEALRTKLSSLEDELRSDLTARATGRVDFLVSEGVETGLAELKNAGLPDLQDVTERGWNDAVSQAFSTVDHGAVEALKTQQIRLMGSVSSNLMQSIHQEVTAAILDGSSISKLEARIGRAVTDPEAFRKAGKTVFHDAQVRVRMIARTETLRAHNEGRKAGYKAMGCSTVKWLASAPCPICAAQDGKEFNLETDEVPTLPYHPNCRCTWLPVLDADTEES